MRNNRAALAVAALAALFLFALTQLVNLAFQRAPVYADYSTYRADPVGARALYETLAALPGVRVERHLRRAARLSGVQATVFWLGETPSAALGWTKQELAVFESIVSGGGRLVIGLLPTGAEYRTRFDENNQKKAAGKSLPTPGIFVPDLEKRWRLRLQRQTVEKHSESDDGARRETAVWLTPLGGEWQCRSTRDGRCRTVERIFGKGTVVIAADTFPLSNEGLRQARQPAWIAELVGPWKRIIFDESHLGIEQTASVGTLIRQFRLEAAALMLVTLAGLFAWRNATSFLPPRPPLRDPGLDADPHRSLTLLLRRAVPAASLADTCLREWQRAKPLLPYRQALRVERVAGVSLANLKPVDAWQRIRRALQEPS